MSLAVWASPNSPNRSPSPKTLELRTKCVLPFCDVDNITLMSRSLKAGTWPSFAKLYCGENNHCMLPRLGTGWQRSFHSQ
jgi:class 3 adenylate cyclase